MKKIRKHFWHKIVYYLPVVATKLNMAKFVLIKKLLDIQLIMFLTKVAIWFQKFNFFEWRKNWFLENQQKNLNAEK